MLLLRALADDNWWFGCRLDRGKTWGLYVHIYHRVEHSYEAGYSCALLLIPTTTIVQVRVFMRISTIRDRMAIISRRTLLSVAAALLYAPILVQATCDPKLSQGFNASGSATASILGGTWNITRYVSYQTGPNSTLYEPITVSAGSVYISKPVPQATQH